MADQHSGSYGYAISNLAYGYLESGNITIRPNHEYDLYAYLRGELDPEDSHGGGWIIRAYYYDSSGTYISYQNAASGGAGSLNTTWRKEGGTVTAPANAASARIRLYNYYNSGWVAWDDVRLLDVTEAETKYYYAAGQRVAMRVDNGITDVVYYLHGDHLGSTSLSTNSSGQEVTGSRTLYYPYGEERWSASGGTLTTDYAFTGQRKERGIGLYDYNARFYDPYLNRFISADTIIPDPADPQSFNRYSYVLGNPIRYTDPSGHVECEFAAECNQPPEQQRDLEDWMFGLEDWLIQTMRENAMSDVVAEIHANLYYIGGNDLEAYRLWIAQVKKGAPWDYKTIIPDEWGRGVWLAGSGFWSFENVANIHFGYVGTAAGFTDIELLGGAGVFQIKDNVVDPMRRGDEPNWDAIGSLATYFDEPEDHAAIQIGIDLYSDYGLLVTVDAFREVFYRHSSELKRGPTEQWSYDLMGKYRSE